MKLKRFICAALVILMLPLAHGIGGLAMGCEQVQQRNQVGGAGRYVLHGRAPFSAWMSVGEYIGGIGLHYTTNPPFCKGKFAENQRGALTGGRGYGTMNVSHGIAADSRRHAATYNHALL